MPHIEHARSLGKACPLPPGVENFMVPEEFPTKVSRKSVALVVGGMPSVGWLLSIQLTIPKLLRT